MRFTAQRLPGPSALRFFLQANFPGCTCLSPRQDTRTGRFPLKAKNPVDDSIGFDALEAEVRREGVGVTSGHGGNGRETATTAAIRERFTKRLQWGFSEYTLVSMVSKRIP